MTQGPKSLVASGYDRVAERYAVAAAAASAAGRDPRQTYLDKAMSLVPGGGVALDLGCGTGQHTTSPLAARLRVVGVDISQRSVALAKVQVPDAAFVVGDMATVAFALASFDLVTAFYSLIHVPREEHSQVFSNIARWLRPGGHVIATMGAGEWEGVDDTGMGRPCIGATGTLNGTAPSLRRADSNC